jgi:predicted DNA-binding protein YlxM (UPF0122 family)
MTIENNLKIIKLIDTYGKLLTDKQLEIISDYYFDNLTLSEIGENFGISRQAVNDCITKSVKLLNEYEEKLNIIESMSKLKFDLENLKSNFTNDDDLNKITKIIDSLN